MSACSCCDDDEDRAYDQGYEEGRSTGYADGYQEAKQDVKHAVLEKLRARRLGADLPLPLYNDVMTLDEVEKMIREAGK